MCKVVYFVGLCLANKQRKKILYLKEKGQKWRNRQVQTTTQKCEELAKGKALIGRPKTI